MVRIPLVRWNCRKTARMHASGLIVRKQKWRDPFTQFYTWTHSGVRIAVKDWSKPWLPVEAPWKRKPGYRSGVFHDVFLKIQILSGAMRSHLSSDTARVRRVIRLLTTKLLLEVAPTTLAAFFILWPLTLTYGVDLRPWSKQRQDE